MTSLYFCPTVREIESATSGGFDTCCAHPDLHVPMPDNEATAAVSQALSDAAKREFQARQTGRRLNYRAQRAESKLAVFLRAVGEWQFGAEQGTYVPLRSLGAIAKAVGREIPDRWELHYQRVEHAEATLAAVREYLELSDDDGVRTREHLLGVLDRAGVPSVVAAELGEDLPELTTEDAVEAMQDMATDLYRAQDRLAFVREMCDLADREQRQVTTEQVRAWTQYTGCANATVDGAELARSLGFALAAMLPGAEPVFCHHENAQGSVHETHQAGWGRKTVRTVSCPDCKARAESTEGEPVLAPYLLNAECCTQACAERHTNGPGCLMAPDWSKPIRRRKP